ncbi:exonuclease domain-containing protein [Agrococcus beijingensis]|uniref:exonuclease domain-containing protein n=1 Tax=Agrococcus beijingensis TaxID=3068634 RepID=UPI002741E948|nr:exonuclease domain-containing protein [Agrococcus sp. REN33]
MPESRSLYQRISDWIFPASTAVRGPILRQASPGSPATEEQSARPSFAVIDVETTGLSPRQHRVLELAVIRLGAEGDVIDEWSTRFNPEGPVGATHIHGITDADVRHAPLFRDLAHDVRNLVGGVPVVAHNARFDLAFLRAEFSNARFDLPYMDAICTLEASHRYLPHLDRRRLADCCAAADVSLSGAHSALGDARATAGLLRHYLQVSGGDGAALLQPSRPPRSRPSPTSRPSRSAPQQPRRIAKPSPKQPPLLTQVTTPSLLELVDDAAPGVMSYLESLLEALEDGALTAGEREALQDLAELHDLGLADLDAAHRSLLLAAAHRAVDDGRVSRDETSQLRKLADLLGQPDSLVKTVLDEADGEREAMIATTLRPIPEGWSLGEPLRVGDRVAFTGCDDAWRERMETRAARLGVRVTSTVSRLTDVLVTDGSFAGTKLDAAQQHGTRIVGPKVFEALLDNLQPRSEVAVLSSSAPATSQGGPGVDPADVRRWAREQGIPVGVRGRLPAELMERYLRSR